MVFRPGHAAQALMHDTNLSFCMHKLAHRRHRAAPHQPPYCTTARKKPLVGTFPWALLLRIGCESQGHFRRG